MFIKQGANESLSDYTGRFNKEALMVNDYTEQFAIHTMLCGLWLRDFKWNITRNTPKTLAAMIEEAQKHTMVKNIVS